MAEIKTFTYTQPRKLITILYILGLLFPSLVTLKISEEAVKTNIFLKPQRYVVTSFEKSLQQHLSLNVHRTILPGSIFSQHILFIISTDVIFPNSTE